MSRVYWDTMIFVYWLEDHPEYGPRVEQIFDSMTSRGDTLCASYLSMGETLARPLKLGRSGLVAQIKQVFDDGEVQMLPFDRAAALAFGRLRASTNLNPADAIHLACAAAANVDLFLTHDKSLHKLKIPGIQFIVGLDGNVF